MMKVFIVCITTSLFIVSIIGTYAYYYKVKNLDREVEKLEQKKLNETIGTSKLLFGEMQKLILNYATSNKCTQFAYIDINERYPDILGIQKLITSTIKSGKYIENMFFYYGKDGYILDCNGLTSISSYYDKDWHEIYENMTDPFTILATRKVKKQIGSSVDSYNNIITFLTRIPYNSNIKSGAIVLNVDVKIISTLLKDITSGDDHAFAFLVNKNGEIISSNKETYCYEDICGAFNIPHEYLNIEAGNFKFIFNGMKMVAYFKTFSINNWKLFYMEPENVEYKKSIYIRSLTFIILFILLQFIAAVSAVFSFRACKPIEEYLKQNKMLMRESFLSQLITGKLFNKIDIKSKADFFLINLSFDYLIVAVIQNNSIPAYPPDVRKFDHDKKSMINMIIKVFKALNVDVICSQDFNDNILVLIKFFSTNEINEMEDIIKKTLKDIKVNMENRLRLSFSIGIGGVYRDLSDIGKSYNEAIKTLDYKFLKGQHTVICYTEISKGENEKLYYPVENEQKLISLVKLCDYEKTIVCLNEMLDDILVHNNNLNNLEICLSNIVGITQRCIFEMNLNVKDVLGEDETANASIKRFKNIQQFSEWISDKFRKVIDYQNKKQKNNTKSFVYEINAYIEKVYMEDISLASIAKYFNYNSSYFCKIFKENMDISFWEYVSRIRIENSKKLLLETKKTVGQIAEAVGYNNRFSYIRTFKKYTSVIPSEYRLKCSQQSLQSIDIIQASPNK